MFCNFARLIYKISRHNPVRSNKQECFPVGCVLPALYRKGVSVQGGLCQGDPSPPCEQNDTQV